MDERQIHDHINDLVRTEHELREKLGSGEITAAEEHERLARTEEQLDQLWDLLRQRQARRDAGENPDLAQERPTSVVENYEG